MTDDLRLLLENVRQEAARLQADGMTADDAWLAAIVTITRRTAEGFALDAVDEAIIHELRRAEREFGNRPVPTKALAVRCGIDDRFRMLRHLSRLEDIGLVHRPFGKRSRAGWRATA